MSETTCPDCGSDEMTTILVWIKGQRGQTPQESEREACLACGWQEEEL